MPLASRLGVPGLDIFHSFGNHLPARANVPLSFTVHDVRALDKPAGYEGKARLLRNIDRSAGVLCLTEYGKGRLQHHCPEMASRVLSVVPHGVDHVLFQPQDPELAMSTAERYGLNLPFLLQLGSWFPHKNLELSIEAFARSGAYEEGLLLAFVGGGADKGYREKLERLAAVLGIPDRLRWIEHVPGSDLPAILSAAKALLQPSRYEGFALPLLESMATGTPGVVTNSSCLPEVSAGIWPVAGEDDAEGFAAGIDRVLFDSQAREKTIADGMAHAAGFTWQRTAELTLEHLARTLSAPA
jgi:glycosyltransferase involved in cell wall biosynthesis